MTPEQLKASILQRAMEGKLVPQDPNDEPASELLKRIKAEKEKLIKEGKIKRDKNETEIFRGDDDLHYEKFHDGSVKQIEVPYEIPESWEWVRFNNIATILRGGSPRPIKDFLTDSVNGINWIKIGDTEKSGKYITDTREKIKKSGLSKTRLVKKGSFLLTNSMSFGRPYILKIDGAIHDGWLSISDFKSSITEDFLYFFLLSRVAYSQFLLLISGAVVKNLNSEKVASIFIPIPPLNEQARITQKIELALSKVDNYHELFSTLRQLNKSFPEKLRKSILQYAMQGELVPQDSTDEPVEVLLERIREEKQRLFEEGKLKKKDLQESIICQGNDGLHYEKFQDGTIKQVDVPFEIPESWKWVRLNNILDVRDGTHTTPKYVKDGVPLLTSKNLINGKLVKEPSKLISLAESNEINKRSRVEENDILLAMIGTIGNPVLVPKIDYQFSVKNVAILKYISTINMEFVYYFIVYFSTKLKSMSSGAVQNFVSLNQLRNILFPVPPTTEQNRIIDKIKKMLILIDRYSYLHNSLEEKN